MIKKIYTLIAMLIYFNIFPIDYKLFDDSMLVDEIKYPMINMGFELIGNNFRTDEIYSIPNNIFEIFETKNNYIKVFNINNPYQGVFLPIGFQDLRVLFNIAPFFIKESKLTENIQSPLTSRQETNSIIPKLSTYVNIDSYYFELTLMSKIYTPQPESEINFNSLNLRESKKTKYFEIPYIRVSIIKEFSILRAGLILSNFINIDKNPEGLNENDLYEIKPYLLHNVFRNPFYRFSEIYDACYFILSPDYIKEYDHHTSTYRINPKIMFNIRNIIIKGNLILDIVNYNYKFYSYRDMAHFQAQRKGVFTSLITNININTPIGKETRFYLTLEKNIFSRLNEKFEYKPDDTKLEYNYDVFDIKIYQDSDFGYDFVFRFLRLTSSLKLTQIDLNYTNPFFDIPHGDTILAPERSVLDIFTNLYIKIFKRMNISIGTGFEIFDNDHSFKSYAQKARLGTDLNFGDLLISLDYNLKYFFKLQNMANIYLDDHDNKGPEHYFLFKMEYKL